MFTEDGGPNFLNKKTVARILGVSMTTVYRLLAEGSLPFVRLRARRMISRLALERFMNRCEREGAERQRNRTPQYRPPKQRQRSDKRKLQAE
jgi:excisionase family DNA binding protein